MSGSPIKALDRNFAAPPPSADRLWLDALSLGFARMASAVASALGPMLGR